MIVDTTDSQNQSNTIETRLRLIEDRQAIHDVIVRYCRGVDRSDPDLVLAAFHDDAIDNHFGVVLPFREAIGTLKAARGGGSPPSKTTSMHNICNVLIEVDGDIARCESYVIVIVRIPQDGGAIDWMHADATSTALNGGTANGESLIEPSFMTLSVSTRSSLPQMDSRRLATSTTLFAGSAGWVTSPTRS